MAGNGYQASGSELAEFALCFCSQSVACMIHVHSCAPSLQRKCTLMGVSCRAEIVSCILK